MRIVAGLALVVVAGCFSKPGACPDATFGIPLDNGDVQWSYDTSMGSLPLMEVTFDNTTPMPCSGGFSGGARWNPKDTSIPLEGSLELRCLTSEGHGFGINVYLDDLANTSGTFTANVDYSYSIPGESTAHTCDGSGTANVTVRDPAGGPAPVPALVSPDFSRTFDIHIDGTMPVTGKALDTPCSPISIELSTTLHIEASDVETHPEKTCPGLG
jgi:hypothetical protein